MLKRALWGAIHSKEALLQLLAEGVNLDIAAQMAKEALLTGSTGHTGTFGYVWDFVEFRVWKAKH